MIQNWRVCDWHPKTTSLAFAKDKDNGVSAKYVPHDTHFHVLTIGIKQLIKKRYFNMSM